MKEDKNTQVNLAALAAAQQPKPRKKRWKVVLISILAVVVALVVAGVSVVMGYLGQIQQVSDLSGDIAVNSSLPVTGVKNIALFGLDTRKDSDMGHSDAIIILSLDYDHDKIKLTSIARDSFVWFDPEDYAFSPKPVAPFQSKLTHAFWWGSHKKKGGGSQTAVKVINKNYQMNITDFVFVNFYEFAEIIDYIGGVEIDVDTAEMGVMNRKYCGYIREMGIDCPDITQTGLQRLNGGQALAYSRNRYTGTDIERGNRQKEVLSAMYAQVGDTSLTKYPTLISKVLEMCHTNLSKGEMLKIATWAVTNTPSMEQFSLPPKGLPVSSGMKYDLDAAADALHDFIYEPEPTPESSSISE